uniref:HMA domain-containing protein n=1 Tax=Aegilops tauschii TaxID=37682 RepID=M8CI99_AEGTA
MPTIIIKVDLDCARCHRKIERVLDRIREKGEFVIDDIEYDEKNNKVIVKGPFDADKLSDKLCCKAQDHLKEIEIVEPPPPPPPEEPKKEVPAPPPPEPEVVVPPPPAVVEEPKCPEPAPEPPKEEPPKEEPPKEEPPKKEEPRAPTAQDRGGAVPVAVPLPVPGVAVGLLLLPRPRRLLLQGRAGAGPRARTPPPHVQHLPASTRRTRQPAGVPAVAAATTIVCEEDPPTPAPSCDRSGPLLRLRHHVIDRSISTSYSTPFPPPPSRCYAAAINPAVPYKHRTDTMINSSRTYTRATYTPTLYSLAVYFPCD